MVLNKPRDAISSGGLEIRFRLTSRCSGIGLQLLMICAIPIMSSLAHAEELIILGRLRAIENDLPYCGFLHTGGVTEYEVLQVVAGSYAQERIFVVHGCIEMPRSGEKGTLSSFVIGDVHKMVLVRENIYGIDTFSEKRIPQRFETFFCKRVDQDSSYGDQSRSLREHP